MAVKVHFSSCLAPLNISIKDMDSERHPAAHCTAVLHHNLKQLHTIFGSVIAQETLNHCDKAAPSCFLLPGELLGEFLALQDLLYLWSDKDTGFDFD